MVGDGDAGKSDPLSEKGEFNSCRGIMPLQCGDVPAEGATKGDGCIGAESRHGDGPSHLPHSKMTAWSSGRAFWWVERLSKGWSLETAVKLHPNPWLRPAWP